MLKKEQYKQMQRTNSLLRGLSVILSVTLLVTSSVNLIVNAKNSASEPAETTISTTEAPSSKATENGSESTSANTSENSSTSTATTTTAVSTTTTTTTTSTTTAKNYKYESRAQEQGYKNLREAKTFKNNEKYYFEVKKDAPDKTISRSSLGFAYDTGVDTYAVYNANGNKVCIPIPSGISPFITEYYFVTGFVVQTIYQGETYWVLLADSNYIYQSGSDLNAENNNYQW